MARRDQRYRGPEKGRYAKRVHLKHDLGLKRIPDERLPKKVNFGVFQEGKCIQDGQKKHYKDTVKFLAEGFQPSN